MTLLYVFLALLILSFYVKYPRIKQRFCKHKFEKGLLSLYCPKCGLTILRRR
jgi:hypothetical protein